MKVSIIGAGNVGATCAQFIAMKGIVSEIVLLDIAEGLAAGKAMDWAQSMPALGFDTIIHPEVSDYSKVANSEVVVVTSGQPRKPGMSREELVAVNVSIVESVAKNAMKYAPNAVFVIVTNPLDTMTLVALKASGLPKNKIIGMGAMLDSNRFRYFLSQKLQKPINEIEAMVIGGHGDTTMIPVKGLATYKGIPISELLTDEAFDEVIKETMVGGATLTKLLGTSAWYGPGAAVTELVDAIVNDKKKLLPNSVYIEGEFGIEGICIGVPCIIGKNGVEKIIQIKLTDADLVKLNASAKAINEVNGLI